MTHGLEHVLSVGGVVEETATLALTGEGSHGVDFAHHQGSHQSVGTNASDVLLVVYLE